MEIRKVSTKMEEDGRRTKMEEDEIEHLHGRMERWTKTTEEIPGGHHEREKCNHETIGGFIRGRTKMEEMVLDKEAEGWKEGQSLARMEG